MANVLIADDNAEMSSVLAEYIKKEGYNVLVAADGGEALDIFSKNELDMVFLDVTMPVLNGYDVCREIRKTSNVPVIMVTSHGDDYEKIMGLGIGADDYIVKPCSPNEVVARMRALLRRIYFEHSEDGSKAHFRYENLEIDMDNFRVCIDDKQVPLTKKELEILEGDIPSPVNPPSGCKFHTRCQYCTEICKQVVPEWRELEEGHFVACHHPLNEKKD